MSDDDEQRSEEQNDEERSDQEQNEEDERQIDAEDVLDEVRHLVREMAPKKKRKKDVRLDSELGSELGIDSLGRAELLQRLEDRFDVALPDRVITEAESPRDLLREVRSAAPSVEGKEIERVEVAEPGGEEAEEKAESAREVVEDAATLLDVLDAWADCRGDRRHILFLDTDTESGQVETRELTFEDLVGRSRDAARALQAMDLDPGDAVGLMLPSGLEYFVAFVGVLRAGGVPVPLYPPMRKSQIEDHLKRQAGILETAQVKILVTFDDVKPLTRLVKAQAPDLEKLVTPQELAEKEAKEGASGDEFLEPGLESDDTAFLQFTSGSTGDPKGVILTHRNLLSNLRSMGEILELDADDDVIVSWLPLYHDMGLIGAWMGALYFGVPLVLMSPLAFLSRPIRWLRAMHKYGGTISAAPNFAYELCLKKLGDDELEGEDLDLSCWRLALNGAEPVSPRSVERFPERFGRFGFEAKAMMPVYGLAENSLAVTFSDPAEAPKIDAVERETFQRDREAVPVEEEDGEDDVGQDAKNEEGAALRFVSCGRPIPNHEVRFVDEDGHEVEERREGRLQFRGPSSTSGYFRNTEETERLIGDDGWLDSEDLGYEAEGEIYLTGRSKDVIVRAGRNVHPQDVEDAIGDLEGVRPGCVAVFATALADGDDEDLVVVAETRIDEENEEEREDLRDRVAAVVRELTGTEPDDVALVEPRTVPKTSSGKIRRSAARELYEEGELGASRRAVWMQVTRLALAGVVPALRRLRRRAGGWLYAARFWLAAALVAVPCWLAVALLPRRSWRRRWVRGSARLLARLTGTRLDVRGEEHLPASDEADRPRIVTANHSSYLDAFVLAAVLPTNCAYVAKAEFRKSFFARVFLDRLGAVFVERFDPRKGEEGSEKTRRALERGDHLVIFPEGTFRRASGLLPFRMGAFVVAARTGTPVVPVVLRGTRSKLRGESFFPRAGDVVVTGRPPEEPEGEDWEDAADLRDRVRESMLERLAEPDLA